MAFQSTTVNPATTSPAQDISKIINDLAQLRAVIGGGSDVDIPMLPAADTIRTIALQALAVTTAKLANLAVTEGKIADAAVTTNKVADGAMTPAKLSTGRPSWDTSGNLTVTGAESATSQKATGAGTVSATALRIVADNTGFFAPASSAVGLVNNGVETWRADATANFSRVIPGGSVLYPDFACRGWVNFDGTTGAIRGSGNIAITRTAAGRYTGTLTSMPDGNFALLGTGSRSPLAQNEAIVIPVALYSATTFQIAMTNGSGSAIDGVIVSIGILR